MSNELIETLIKKLDKNDGLSDFEYEIKLSGKELFWLYNIAKNEYLATLVADTP